MCVTTFFTQKQIMKRSGPVEGQAATVQRLMLYGMPLSLFVSGFFFPIGVLIYWVTNNAWTFGQQFFILRKMPPPGSRRRQGEGRRATSRPSTRAPSRPSRAPSRSARSPAGRPPRPRPTAPTSRRPAPPTASASAERRSADGRRRLDGAGAGRAPALAGQSPANRGQAQAPLTGTASRGTPAGTGRPTDHRGSPAARTDLGGTP